MNWSHLWEVAGRSFYTEFLDELASIFVIIAYVAKKKRPRRQILLVTIAIASLIQSLIYQSCNLQTINPAFRNQIIHYSIYTYILIETICCLTYLKIHINSDDIKKVISITRLLFGSYIISFVIFFSTTRFTYVEVTEAFLVIVFSLYLLYELFVQKAEKKIFSQSVFWATSGMLILFSSTMPLFLFLKYLTDGSPSSKYSLFTINHMAYMLLFTSFTVAVLRNK